MAQKPDRIRTIFCAHHRQGISIPARLKTRIDFEKICGMDRFCSGNTTKKELLSIKSSFFVYPSRSRGFPKRAKRVLGAPQAWHIITTQSCNIISPFGLYLITRQRAACLRFDETQDSVLILFTVDSILRRDRNTFPKILLSLLRTFPALHNNFVRG